MNKTLLLILCDFLLLNLLALTRWEKAEPARAKQPPVPELNANAATKDQDLVNTMRESLVDEKATRDQLVEKLNAADANLATREQSLTQLQSEKTQLTTKLTATEQSAQELGQKVAAATQDATFTKEQLAQIQRELAEKRTETERQKAALATLEQQQAVARKQIEGLTVAVIVGEQEKKTLREQTDTLKGQVEAERTERIKVQETTTKLANGVGQLAEKSTELTKEIRDNRPINANVLFNEFLANRVTASFTAYRKGFLGAVNRAKEAKIVLVRSGAQIYALTHIEDTVFSYGENGSDWTKIGVNFPKAGAASSAPSLNALALDPRVVAIPVSAEQASALGSKIYAIAPEPFKFPEAVLISGGGEGYGEVAFKLDAAQPGYVRVDNRLLKRLFGTFAPSRGDLVLSKTGELLGIMVNRDYCALVKDFTVLTTISTGEDTTAQGTGALLDGLIARVRALPLEMQ
jgi:X-X-X-Leu-X-X-Gly heptad repeat protein